MDEGIKINSIESESTNNESTPNGLLSSTGIFPTGGFYNVPPLINSTVTHNPGILYYPNIIFSDISNNSFPNMNTVLNEPMIISSPQCLLETGSSVKSTEESPNSYSGKVMDALMNDDSSFSQNEISSVPEENTFITDSGGKKLTPQEETKLQTDVNTLVILNAPHEVQGLKKYTPIRPKPLNFQVHVCLYIFK